MPREKSIDAPELKLLGQALRTLRARADLSMEAAGDRAGLTREGWRKYEAGINRSIFHPSTQEKLARAVGADPAELMAERERLLGRNPPPAPANTNWPAPKAEAAAGGLIPLRGTARAGTWGEPEDLDETRPSPYPATRDPRYGHAPQWLCEVAGDSMAQAGLNDGDLVHCVDAEAAGYFPRTGDLVLVERSREGGAMRELSIKQVDVTPEGVRLWPRSANPRHRSPLTLADSGGEQVQIRALVIAAIRRF